MIDHRYNNRRLKKGEVVRFFTLTLLFILILPTFGMGLKIVKQYPIGMLADVMPWEIDETGGWSYIASDEGLIQFDGSEPELFLLNNRRPVRSVTIDPETGNIFAGGISEFGYFRSSPLTSLEYVCLSDSVGEDKRIGNIWGIYKNEGKIIAQGDNEILVYDLDNHSHTIIEAGCKLDVSSMIDGVLWLGTDDGLKLLLASNVVNVPHADELKGRRIRKILPFGGRSGLLIVTSDGIWTYENQKLTRIKEYDELLDNWGEIFSADLRGDILALGSVSNGLGLINLSTGEYENYDESKGLPSNTIISLKFNSRGDLLIGMQFGVAKLLLNEPIENLDNTSNSIGSGYVLAQKGKNLYIGTNRGLYNTEFDINKGKVGDNIKRVGDLRGQVWGISNIDGQLLASLDHGLYLIDENSQSYKISDLSGVWDVRKMLGTIDRAYVGSYSGLHMLRKRNGNWEYESPVEEYWQSIYNFVQEKGDVIWNDRAEDGIERLIIDTIQNRISEIRNFKVTSDGFPLTADVYITRIDNNVYFGTDNGVYIYDEKSDEILKEKEISRLLGNPKSVRRLKKVNGNLFALTDNELIAADPAGILGTKRISLAPSVTRPMHEGDVFFPIGTDHLAYPIRSGYLIFDYSEKSDSLWKNWEPSARINAVKITNRGDSAVFRANFEGLKYEPELNYRENSVRVEFGNWENLERGVLYSTKINKEPWSAPSEIISKEITDLRPGKYKFEVKAISTDGREATDSVTFRISPPWWRSNWMLSIYAVVVIALIFGLLRWFQVQMGKRNRRLLYEKDKELAFQQALHRKETEEKDRKIEELEREQIEKELKHKSQEMVNVMMSLTHKNDTLQIVKRELQNILTLVPRGNNEVRKAIAGLQEKVVVDIKSDDVLKRVEEEFDIIHDNFMKRLRERYPDLNPNEIMLCAYLKMNLSTKEIAPLMNISTRGVETIRYRLRKKLSLDREESLASFISNFK